MKTLRKLLALAFGPVLLALGLIVFATYIRTETLVREQLDQLAEDRLPDEIKHLNEVFHDARVSLQLLASVPVVENADVKTIQTRLQEWQKNFPHPVEALYYNTADGMAYGSDGSEFDTRDRYYYRQISRGEMVITRAIKSRASGKPIVLILVPVFSPETGQRTGALGASILLENMLARVISINPGYNGYAILTDDMGHYISGHTRESRQLLRSFVESAPTSDDPMVSPVIAAISQKNDSKLSVKLPEGKATVYSQTVPNTAWHLSFVYPDSQVFAVRRSVRNLALILLMVSLPFVLVAVWRAKRDITEPIQALVASESRWRSLVENAPFLITTIDSSGKILFANHGISGTDQRKIIGSKVYEHIDPSAADKMQAAIGELFATGETKYWEVELASPDGQKHWHAHTLGAIKENSGISKAVLITVDISARRQAESRAAESELRFRSIFDRSFQFIGLLTPDGTMIEANQTALDFIDAKLADVVGKPFWETPWWNWSTEEQARLKKAVESAAAGDTVHYQTRNQKADGALRIIDFSMKPLRNETGEIVALIPEGRDITALKEAADALQASEARLAAVLENNFGYIWSINRDYRYLTFNSRFQRAAEKLVGRPPLIGSPIDEILTPEVAAYWRTLYDRALDGEKFTIEMCHGVGVEERQFDVAFYPIENNGEISGVSVYAVEITSRKKSEAALRASESRLRHLVEDARDIIFTLSPEGIITSLNPAFTSVLGWPCEEWLGKDFHQLLTPDERPAGRELFQEVCQGSLVRSFELRMPAQDGKTVYLELTAVPLVNEGKVVEIQSIARDVSARRQAETTLRLQSQVLESMSEGVGVCDENGFIIYANPAEEKMFGVAAGELSGVSTSALTAYEPADNARIHAEIQAELAEHGYCSREVLSKRKDDTTFTSLLSLRRLKLAGEDFTLWVREDVTERRKLEQQLLQSQKMDSIGHLAGGVAHDFNNILTVIQGHAGLLQLFGNLHPEASEAATEIIRASERASNLTRQLLAFSRQQQVRLRETDVGEIVAEMSKMLRRLLGEDIQLDLHLEPQLPRVMADAGMLQQVLLNLAVNARDAMPGGGKLMVKTQVVYRTRKPDPLAPELRTRFVCLSVVDNGCGIPEDHLEKIFDPFFTTKEVGKGTGLGLATVYGIVKQHQGWVEVDSQLNIGTTFSIFLPPAKSNSQTGTESLEAAEIRGGTEKILLVEDEAPLRSLVKTVLEKLGYAVFETRSGAEALEFWKAHDGMFDLLLTDIVMPEGINGLELAGRLQQEKPGLKIILTSGYSSQFGEKDSMPHNKYYFLAKPYHTANLARMIRDCLDNKIPLSA